MLPFVALLVLAGCSGNPTAKSAEPVTPPAEEVVAQTPGGPRHIRQRVFQLADLDTATLKIGENEFEVWIADTWDKRMEGMMFLNDGDVEANQGMLFLFEEDSTNSFWMKNTLIPLDIAYIDKDKKIVTTYTMKALDSRPNQYLPEAPYRFALELKAGTFEELGISPGMTVEFPDEIRVDLP